MAIFGIILKEKMESKIKSTMWWCTMNKTVFFSTLSPKMHLVDFLFGSLFWSFKVIIGIGINKKYNLELNSLITN